MIKINWLKKKCGESFDNKIEGLGEGLHRELEQTSGSTQRNIGGDKLLKKKLPNGRGKL